MLRKRLEFMAALTLLILIITPRVASAGEAAGWESITRLPECKRRSKSVPGGGGDKEASIGT